MTRREQTRTAKVQAMLRRPGGASLEAICTATGWQPHSARAALSGMRKAGYTIAREAKAEKGAGSVYRITAGPGAAK